MSVGSRKDAIQTSGELSRTPVTRRMFEPIRTPRTFEAAIEHIVEGIERAGLRRGDRLPNERQLAEQLGISTPTLRQAVVVLGRSGLLTVRVGKGGGITMASDLVPADVISTAVALEEQAAVDALRARRVLEPSIARYVTLVATDADLEPLERANELLESHLKDRKLATRADAMFHRALARASHNRGLETAARGISGVLYAVRDTYGGGREEQSLQVHRTQVAAMRNRDLATLDAVVDEHLTMLETAFAKGIGEDPRRLFGEARTVNAPRTASES